MSPRKSIVIMSAVNLPRRGHNNIRARHALAKLRATKNPKRLKALRAIGELKGFALPKWQKQLDIDVKGAIGSRDHKGRIVNSLEIEARLAANPHVEVVRVTIDSPGGYVKQSQRIHHALRNHGAYIETTVDGLAASAAVDVLMAGDWREAWMESQIMIHPCGLVPSERDNSTRWTAARLHKFAHVLAQTDDYLIDQMVARTGAARKRIEREFLNEEYMSLPTAISLGLIHAMVGAAQWFGDYRGAVNSLSASPR
jgi:ATP-dependent protease ClpP protease subunit